MSTITDSITKRLPDSVGQGFNWQYFLQDNITGNWLRAIWVIVLTIVTTAYTVQQMGRYPVTTTAILVLLFIGILLAAADGLHIRHSRLGNWLKNNLLSSVSNVLLTLLLLLFVVAITISIWDWAVVNANFNPDETTPEYRNPDGATWGVIIAAWDLLIYGRFPREALYRVWMTFGYFFLLGGISYFARRIGLWQKNRIVSRILMALWVLSPFIVYIFLAGIDPEGDFINIRTLIIGEILVLGTYALITWQRVTKFSWLSLIGWALAWPLAYAAWQAIGRSEAFPPINVDLWGGLLLTLIIAAAVIVLSFPLGMVLALGRRSEVRGIPGWLIWPVALAITIYLLANSTPELLETAEGFIQRMLAFWPLLILIIAYILQRTFKGNVIAFTSTAFIEIVRGVPLITLLFMGIIMAPFFLPEGAILQNIWAVIIAYSLFSAAYMAELIRGGLQALPKGQFEAADAIGLNTLQKMRFIILPQALRIVIPGIVGQFIGAYKNSSLVALVGLFELTGVVSLIVANPEWLGLRQELYVFIGIVYFIGSFLMSWYSRRLEARLSVGQQ